MKIVWLHQRQELQRLAVAENLPAMGKRGHLKDALSFGEMLTLVSDNENASRLICDNPQGALAFLDMLSDLDNAIESAKERPSPSEMEGPFHELADFAIEFMNELREIAPEKFE